MWCLFSPRRMLHPQGFPYWLCCKYIYTAFVYPALSNNFSTLDVFFWWLKLHNLIFFKSWQICGEGSLISWAIIVKMEWNSIRLRHRSGSDCEQGTNFQLLCSSLTHPAPLIGIKKRGRLRVSFFCRQLTCAANPRQLTCAPQTARFIINFTS